MQVFSKFGSILSVTIAKKRDPNQSGTFIREGIVIWTAKHQPSNQHVQLIMKLIDKYLVSLSFMFHFYPTLFIEYLAYFIAITTLQHKTNTTTYLDTVP